MEGEKEFNKLVEKWGWEVILHHIPLPIIEEYLKANNPKKI